MKLRVLGCFGGQTPDCHLSSFLIEDQFLVDAGAATSSLSLEEQVRIDHVLITHSHLDHTCGISFLADNVFAHRQNPVMIHSIPYVIQQLRAHMFNDTLWPDFTRIPTADSPTLTFQTMAEGTPYAIEDLVFTPIAVSHTVPTVGYLVRGRGGAVLYTADTGPTEEIWKVAGSLTDLKAIIAEISFPNRLQELADLSGHLTPQALEKELAKAGTVLPPIYITHMKPQFLREIAREVPSRLRSKVQILEQGRSYLL